MEVKNFFFSFDKIQKRIKYLSSMLGDDLPRLNVNPFVITQQVCSRIFDGVATRQLDELASQICASMMTEHPDYGVLASRIVVSNHQKNTSPSFSEVIHRLYHYKDCHGVQSPLISRELYDIVMENKFKLNEIETGVVITSVKDDSSAQKAGLNPGMVIIRVGQVEVNSIDVIDNAIKNAVKQKRKALLLLVKVESGSRFVALELK